MIRNWLSKIQSETSLKLGLVIAAAACIVYEHGLASGSRMCFGLAYLLVLLRSGVLVSMGFLLRTRAFAQIDLILLSVVPTYLTASVVAGWPGVLFLSLIGTIGGLFVGTVCGLASPYHRWR